MKTDLRGTLRTAARLCRRQWRGLMAASVLPFLLGSVVSTIQLWQMRDIYAAGLAANLTPTPDVEAQFQAVIQGRGLLFLGFFIFNALIVAWHFTRIVQFWKKGTARALGVEPGELHETAAVVAYALFVGLVLFAGYFIAVVGLVLASEALAILGAAPEAQQAAAGLAGLALLLIMLAMAMRFFAGFPGIAQGGTPRPFRDLWPLAQGLTFALTWRAFLVFLIFVAVSIVLLVVFMVPLVASTGGEIVDPATGTIGPNAAQALAAVLAPAQVVAQVLRAAFLAYFTTFLTLVFAKLSGQADTLKS